MYLPHLDLLADNLIWTFWLRDKIHFLKLYRLVIIGFGFWIQPVTLTQYRVYGGLRGPPLRANVVPVRYIEFWLHRGLSSISGSTNSSCVGIVDGVSAHALRRSLYPTPVGSQGKCFLSCVSSGPWVVASPTACCCLLDLKLDSFQACLSRSRLWGGLSCWPSDENDFSSNLSTLCGEKPSLASTAKSIREEAWPF